MKRTRSLRTFLLLALLMALMLPLAACGKKGPPGLPPGQTDQYPRQYPNPNEP
jgi:predicted small lipoprotein YifL